MRKRYFLFLFVICLVCCLCACGSSGNSASGTDDESTNSVSGTLPEVESEHTNAHRVRIETSYGTNGELYYRQEYIYGDDGGYASVTSYRADGSESGHVDLTYNEQGDRLIGYRTVGVGRKNTSDAPLPLPVVNEKTGKVYSVQYEYDYDSDGRIIKQIETDDEYGDGACIYEYEYDSTGKKVCSTMYRENSNEYRKTIYEYDSNGNLTVSKEYRVSSENPDGNLSFMMLYDCDGEPWGAEMENFISLHDMDADGVPELFITNGFSGKVTMRTYVYTCINGKIEYIGNAPGYSYLSKSEFSGVWNSSYFDGAFYAYYYNKDGSQIRDELVRTDDGLGGNVVRQTSNTALFNASDMSQMSSLQSESVDAIRKMGWEPFANNALAEN